MAALKVGGDGPGYAGQSRFGGFALQAHEGGNRGGQGSGLAFVAGFEGHDLGAQSVEQRRSQGQLFAVYALAHGGQLVGLASQSRAHGGP